MKYKKGIAIVLSVAAGICLGIFILNNVLEKKVAEFLSENFPNETLTYKTLDVNMLFSELELCEIYFTSGNQKISTQKLEVNGIHFWQLLMDGKVEVQSIFIDKPQITYFKGAADSTEKETDTFKRNVEIHRLEIDDGHFALFGKEGNRIFSVKRLDLEINDIYLDGETLKRKIPFDYGKHFVKIENLFCDCDEYHNIQIAKFYFSNKKIRAKNLELLPKYSRPEFRKKVSHERDIYNLKIASLSFDNPKFGFNAENLFFTSTLLRIEGADFKIYRDKTLPDDTRYKELYSEKLREAKLKLDIKNVEISESFIQYQERIKFDRSLGTVAFYDVNAEISNLTNRNLADENFPLTKVNVRAHFMNTTDLYVNWEFRVNDEDERFTISGNAGKIPPAAMNPFFVPAMQIKAKGNLDALYFNFGGNNIRGNGDLRVNYSDFKIEVLKKNGDKNKFLSAIANLFVKKSPKNGTVTTSGIAVVRDQTKSFWNYFWTLIEEGLLKSMT
ncbi:MAG TPA: hypothetical protein VFM82_12425 [Flavobacteriaceae bacterium]|nr:hypothetical protein [Flavobacteriaceae bacterium]